MAYYGCSTEELYHELRRRGYIVSGSRDQLSEALDRDDRRRGTEATTIATIDSSPSAPRELDLLRTSEFGLTAPVGLLVNERIAYWTMNTFFPTLQLFFESGISCTFAGGGVSNVMVGLDPSLRFRLTDCTHEEDGRIVKTIRPDKFVRSGTGILVKESAIAQRTSIVVKSCEAGSDQLWSRSAGLKVGREVHTVVGLRLEGMGKMAYVWAKAVCPTVGGEKTWGNIRIAGLRDDTPASVLGYPVQASKPGKAVALVLKKSQIGNTGRDMSLR